ncbi:hypothetical protein N4R57_10240 [Rhodobacteraceae bacterium D3-12]|nr:hypothetical protein N4R57_10240 [Rhodobacteraceae bacterium D3-12]
MLQTYAVRPECYTDCFVTEVANTVTFADYVTAFYNTPLFKLERLILRITVKRPSTDADVIALAQGETDSFAAWTVEARADAQILLCDLSGATRSWLMLAHDDTTTRLFFGSAVVPRDGAKGMGLSFRLLLGAHKLYSRALLASASRRLHRIR